MVNMFVDWKMLHPTYMNTCCEIDWQACFYTTQQCRTESKAAKLLMQTLCFQLYSIKNQIKVKQTDFNRSKQQEYYSTTAAQHSTNRDAWK